ncbi:MAG: bifunctional glutamate N-acetyltransferase/amino-acid acetyltransferase ArgJ [Solobacterium sp.]|nr:bifunctional glutamate N-acetyltransferase/amino-acid acetyltransferase ArgJ [Solobacterium sp.]
MIEFTDGGVCAAEGFSASGIHCGIRKNKTKEDLALICSDVPCQGAGLFTRNQVKAAPVLLDMEVIRGDSFRAIIANSGIANACAPHDMENALKMQKTAAEALGVKKEEVLVGSTGVIGMDLDVAPIEAGMPALIRSLSSGKDGSDHAAQAIMTTDTRKKELAVKVIIGGKKVHIGGIAKGSGMIHPNMGTMLCYLTTDCAIQKPLLQKALKTVCDRTFNRISVDGDTSTNDSLILLANGLAQNPEITEEGTDYDRFLEALLILCTEMARRMAADGEGAKHLITCHVTECESEDKAELLAKSVIRSPLTKAAVFGCDANWGRVLCALGYSGASFDPGHVGIQFSSAAGTIEVCESGKGLPFDEVLAKKILEEPEVIIDIQMGEGYDQATAWGCDLTYDYVRINGDYRT